MFPVLGVLWLPALPLWGYALCIALLLLVGAVSRARWGRAASWGVAGLCLVVLALLLSALEREAVAVNSFGVTLSLAFLVGFAFFVWSAPRQGLDPRESSEVALASVVVGLLSARLGYLLLHQGAAQGLQLFEGGFSSAVGLVGGGLYAWWFAARRGIAAGALAQTAALSVLLGVSLGKLGCLLHGCDFGAPTEAFTAVTYPAEWPNLLHEGGWLQSPISVYQHSADFAARFPEWVSRLAAYDDRAQGAPLSLPVHPLPLYEALGSLLLFLACAGWVTYHARRGQPAAPSRVAAWALSGYAALRLGSELFRGDEEPRFYSLTSTQWVALLTLGGVVIWRLRRGPAAAHQP